ncbi:hypothetical protein KCU65_g8269, partial [Aureobasidium melanogenum]
MSLAQSNTRGGPQAFEAQQRRLDFASVKQACPKGIYLTPTPRDPHVWQGVLFVRKGPYTPAILKFSLLLAADKPPTITFSTDIFHPLVTPLTTYTYTTSDTGADTVHASDDERLPPGGFSLRHGFPQWFGRKKPKSTSQVGVGVETVSISERSQSSYGPLAIVQILFYMRSAFDTAEVLDKVPLEAAGNPGAWHAWQTHRARIIGAVPRSATPEDGKTPASPTLRQQPGGARRPGQWNWEGVWEERVKKGVQASISQQTLFGTTSSNDDLINFLNIDIDTSDIPWHTEQEAGDNLNTNPKTLEATQNSKSKTSSSTGYGHTPGALGLHGWHPPQAHMFVSAPASVGSFSTINHPTRANTSPTNATGQNRPTVGGSPETRLSSRTSGSPLKVRKTRENLRTGFIDDAASTGGHSVHDLVQNKHSSAQPLREIQNTVHDETTRPSSRNNRFSWESDTLHLTTVIERSSTKRTSSQSEKTEPKSAPSLSRKLSVRKRVVSRVREGLLSRSKSSSKVPVRVDDDVAISRSASEHERPVEVTVRDPSQDMEDGTIASHNLASASVQSLSAVSLSGDPSLTIDISHLPEVAVKSVLPGSDGSYPSPSQEAKPSPSPSPEKTPRPRRFAQLSQTRFETQLKPLSILHVNLSIKPAWETLDVADDATMWAMIKAEASLSSNPLPTGGMSDMRRSASPEHIVKIQKPLNIIVIIDNSSFASSLALQSISDFIRQWGAIHEDEDKYGVDIEIEKAKFAARNYPPDVAIRILHKKFGKFWSGNDGPPVLHRLREELEFQKRAWTEMPKGVVQSSTAATKHQNSRITRQTTLHLADTEALQVFNTAPSTPTPDEGDPNIGMPVAEQHSDHEQRLDSLVIQDEARRIWRHMRRNSRTTSGVSSASDASSRACSGAPQQEQKLQQRGSQESIVDRMAAADTRINEIRLKAIQNKRSVGAETLREFSMMHQQNDGGPSDLRDEACMPWL